jgi:hypothetical protein
MGWSDASWGNPILPHSGGRDAFVAKLKSTGQLEWNTFVRPCHPEVRYQAGAIAVDGSGGVYVLVTSPNPDGRPSALLAKLDEDGELLWERFMTTYGDQIGTAVALDAAGNIYVGGWGGWLWDTPPVEPFPDAGNSFVAKLNSSGVEVWHALLAPWLGEDGFSECRTLAVDRGGNVYATGRSTLSWGAPINRHAGGADAYVAKLSSNGFLRWNTFMGSRRGFDYGSGIALDESGNVYVSGGSEAACGKPVTRSVPHGGGFVAKLDRNGVRKWRTFLGEMGWAIAVDRRENIYATGVWGLEAPGFVAALNRDGVLQWTTLVDAILDEMVLGTGDLYVAGQIDWPSGTPVNPHVGGWDAFVAKVEATHPPRHLR